MNTESRKKLLFSLVVLVIYYIITVLVLYFIGTIDFKQTEITLYEPVYPRKGAEYEGLACFIMMLIFIILTNILVIRHLKTPYKILTNIFIVFLFFFTMETSIRWYIRNFPLNFKPHPYLIYERERSSGINSMGIREKEIPLQKEEGEFRLLVLGDSSTDGVGVEASKRYSSILERKLSASFPGRKVTVINGGIPGYTSFSIVRLYEKRLSKYNPDALIIAINNDCSRGSMCSKDRVCSMKMLPIFSLLYKSELYLLLRKVINRQKDRIVDQRPQINGRENPEMNRLAVSTDDVKENYLKLINDIKARGGDNIIVVMPRKQQVWRRSRDLQNYIQLKKQISDKEETLYVNFFDEWKDKTDADENLLFIDDLHPSEKGNALIGERLYELIMQKGLKGLNR